MPFNRMICCSCVLALGLAGPASSAVFENHSRIELNGFGYVVNSPWDLRESSEASGPNALGRVFDDPYTDRTDPSGAAYWSTSTAAAFTTPYSPDFLGAGASVRFGSTTVGNANAYWRDITYYSGATVGSFIRLSLTVEATLGGAIGSRSFMGLTGATKAREEHFPGSLGSGDWYVSNWSDIGGVQFTDGGVLDPNTGEILSAAIFEIGHPWDSYTLVNGLFIGQTHLDVPYDEELGGYVWMIGIQAQASAHYSSSFVSSMNSVGLTAVTDLDGNPITGLSFDSGMIYVPEVPSMYLAPGAGIILFTFARLHSMRKLRV